MAQVILVQGETLLSKAIQKSTGSPYSHIGFLFGVTTVEADIGGVQVKNLNRYPYAYDIYDIRNMTWEKHEALRKWCLGQIGRPYDYSKIFGIWLELMFDFVGVRPILKSPGALCCVEFIELGLAMIGESLRASDTLTPTAISRDPVLIRRTFNINC